MSTDTIVKHTDAPWRVEEGFNDYDIVAGNARLAGYILRKEDADVMAAALDLLAALKTTAGNIRSLGPAGALKNVPMEYREWLRVVEEAIAKAEHR